MERNFCGCAQLEVLDAQHSEVPAGAMERLHRACPHLRTFLHTQRQASRLPSPSDVLQGSSERGRDAGPDRDGRNQEASFFNAFT
jgi:hypothetical protein